MRQVGGDAWGVDDIVEGEVVDFLARFEEEGEWLLSISKKLMTCL